MVAPDGQEPFWGTYGVPSAGRLPPYARFAATKWYWPAHEGSTGLYCGTCGGERLPLQLLCQFDELSSKYREGASVLGGRIGVSGRPTLQGVVTHAHRKKSSSEAEQRQISGGSAQNDAPPSRKTKRGNGLWKVGLGRFELLTSRLSGLRSVPPTLRINPVILRQVPIPTGRRHGSLQVLNH